MTFNFFIGGYGGDSYRLILNNNELSFYEYYGRPWDPKGIIPIKDNQDWKLVLGFLTNCRWLKSYHTPVCDGTQWELVVKAKGINIKSSGSNAYPKDFKKLLVLLNIVGVI
jgi:hypothetical protein